MIADVGSDGRNSKTFTNHYWRTKKHSRWDFQTGDEPLSFARDLGRDRAFDEKKIFRIHHECLKTHEPSHQTPKKKGVVSDFSQNGPRGLILVFFAARGLD